MSEGANEWLQHKNYGELSGKCTFIMTQESTAPGHYRWYVVVLLMGIYTCQTLDRTVLNTLLEPIKREFGLSDSQLGFMAGITYAIPYAVMAIPLGMLTDRLNRVRLLAFVATMWSVLTAFSGFAASYATLLLARAGVGAMEAGCPPNAASLTADYFPPQQRSAATAAFLAGSSLGMLGGFAIGGIIAMHYGWRTAFFAAGLPGILLSLAILFTVKEPRRGSKAEPNPDVPSLRTTLGFIKGQKSLVHLFAALILLHVSLTGTTVWAASYLARFHGMQIREAGIVLAIGLGLFGFFGTAAGGVICDRVGGTRPSWRIKAPIVSLVLCTVFWGAMLLSPAKVGAIGFLWAWALFNVGWIGGIYGLFVSLVEPRMRGTTMSLAILLANGVGASIGPQLVGFLSDQLSPFAGSESLRYALFAAIPIYVWAIGHCYLASRTVEADLLRMS